MKMEKTVICLPVLIPVMQFLFHYIFGGVYIYSIHYISIFIANYLSVTHAFFQEMVFIDIYSFNGRQNEGQTNFLILWIFNEPFVP